MGIKKAPSLSNILLTQPGKQGEDQVVICVKHLAHSASRSLIQMFRTTS